MPDNGRFQLQTADDARICEIVSSFESLERTKVATKLYGGGYLMQTVGNPTRILNLKLRAWSDAERDAVNAAEAECAVIKAKLGDAVETGYLLDAPSWSVIIDGAVYETGMKFVVIA